MKLRNRQWCVGARPVGKPKLTDFLYKETNIPRPHEGEVLLKTMYNGIAPVMRMYMQGKSAAGETPLDIGEVIHGRGVARVIESHHPNYSVGDVVQGQLGWQTYKVSQMTSGERFFKIRHHDIPYALSVRMLSMTGLTAWTSFFEQGKPHKGETVLVSGAAGGVGHMVVQMAKIMGCHVVGIAGGVQKCTAVQALGADAMIDYKNENVATRIRELCPDGVDIYYDNVGGEILTAALDNLAMNARIILCGSISEYARPDPFGLTNYTNLRRVNAAMHGYFVYNYLHRFEACNDQLAAWYKSGELKPLLDIVDGFDKLPSALIGVYDGANIGMRCVRVNDDET